MNIQDRNKRIVQYAIQNPDASNAEIAVKFEVSKPTVYNAIHAARKSGIVIQRSEKRGRKQKHIAVPASIHKKRTQMTLGTIRRIRAQRGKRVAEIAEELGLAEWTCRRYLK